MPGLIMPYVDTVLRLLPLGTSRAAAPDWHDGRGFFGASGQHSQGMQCGHSPTGWKGPLGQCPAAAQLGGYAGARPGSSHPRALPGLAVWFALEAAHRMHCAAFGCIYAATRRVLATCGAPLACLPRDGPRAPVCVPQG